MTMVQVQEIFEALSGYFVMWVAGERTQFETATGGVLIERIVSATEIEYIGAGFTITFWVDGVGEHFDIEFA